MSTTITKWPEITKQIHISRSPGARTHLNPRFLAIINHRLCLIHRENMHWYNKVRDKQDFAVNNMF